MAKISIKLVFEISLKNLHILSRFLVVGVIMSHIVV
jgi:hypothetical protein